MHLLTDAVSATKIYWQIKLYLPIKDSFIGKYGFCQWKSLLLENKVSANKLSSRYPYLPHFLHFLWHLQVAQQQKRPIFDSNNNFSQTFLHFRIFNVALSLLVLKQGWWESSNRMQTGSKVSSTVIQIAGQIAVEMKCKSFIQLLHEARNCASKGTTFRCKFLWLTISFSAICKLCIVFYRASRKARKRQNLSHIFITHKFKIK